jgi:hypothetical protein
VVEAAKLEDIDPESVPKLYADAVKSMNAAPEVSKQSRAQQSDPMPLGLAHTIPTTRSPWSGVGAEAWRVVWWGRGARRRPRLRSRWR